MTFTGAYTKQDELIALRFHARLQLTSRKRSLSTLAGPYRSSFRGRGMDFEEVRSYQPGDETRSIDWRVTARTTIPHTKVFREERERPVLLLVDQRRRMFFGSQCCFKSVLAAQVAGLLAWSALKMNDRVGGLIIGEHGHAEVRPKRGKASVLQLLHAVHDYNCLLAADGGHPNANAIAPAQQRVEGDAMARSTGQPELAYNSNGSEHLSLSESLQDLRRIARPGSAIFLLSDFHDFDEQSARHLFHIARHNEVTALHFHDRLEQHLPPAGQYTVTDGLQRAVLNTRQSSTRHDYQDRYAKRRTQLQQDMAKNGVPLISLQTGCKPLEELLRYYIPTRLK